MKRMNGDDQGYVLLTAIYYVSTDNVKIKCSGANINKVRHSEALRHIR